MLKGHQAGAGAAVVNGSAGNAGAAQFLESGLVDHGAADVDTHVVDLLSAGCAHIDEQRGDQVDLVLLFSGSGVVGLGAEDAGMPLAVLAADHQLQTGQDLLRDAAQAVDLNEAVGFDLADDEAQLVHVAEDHGTGQAGIGAGNLGNARICSPRARSRRSN